MNGVAPLPLLLFGAALLTTLVIPTTPALAVEATVVDDFQAVCIANSGDLGRALKAAASLGYQPYIREKPSGMKAMEILAKDAGGPWVTALATERRAIPGGSMEVHLTTCSVSGPATTEVDLDRLTAWMAVEPSSAERNRNEFETTYSFIDDGVRHKFAVGGEEAEAAIKSGDVAWVITIKRKREMNHLVAINVRLAQ